jgi:single-stranded-DNA-specific exonuclease
MAALGDAHDLILCVDCGTLSHDPIAAATCDVIVLDHHLGSETLPQALAVVNPNRQDETGDLAHLCAASVVFLTLVEANRRLKAQGQQGPDLMALLDLVALATVADVAPLIGVNRAFVRQGLKVMARRERVGLRALADSARLDQAPTAYALGFVLGPRINAAGRLADMGLGIRCLTTDDDMEALELARELDTINRERRQIETVMKEQALSATDSFEAGHVGASVCVMHPEWHQGVVGLVASRLKDRFFRPTLAFAPAGEDELRGSGRSIPDVHLRDVLDLVSKRHPGLIRKFGGHAMAAGLTLGRDDFDRFAPAFEQAVIEMTGRKSFEPVIETDGSLETGYANAQVAGLLAQEVWGAGFAAPLFLDEFRIRNQKLVGEKHLKLVLERGSQRFDAIWFGRTDSLPERIQAAYRLEQNVWNGMISVQLVLEHAQAA